jgi:diguanylate cyclase (GGDEF)-like protein
MAILVVEDSPDDGLLIQTLLKNAGHGHVIVADSVAAGWGFLEKPGDDERIELVLVDYDMPGGSGLDLCRRMRSHAALQYVPVMMVTAARETATLQFAFAEGVVEYIRKPIVKVDFLARVRVVLRTFRELIRRREREQELLAKVQELEFHQCELQRLAAIDAVTGVGTRQGFHQMLARTWDSELQQGRPLAVVLADCDSFKRHNHQYGHTAGDHVLHQVVEVVATLVPRKHIMRYGSDEIVLMLPETETPAALDLAETWRTVVDSMQLGVTLSIGVAVVRLPGDVTPVTLLHQVECAVMRAKEMGGNRVVNMSEVIL